MADRPDPKPRPTKSGPKSTSKLPERADPALQPSNVRPALPDMTGKVLGDFRVRRRIGGGGMGEVFLAEQLSLKRPVALKVLRREVAEDPVFCKRFEIEATAAARLAHSNIVQIYAVGEHEGTRFMALEFVQGLNLRDYVAKKGPVSPRLAFRVLQQVASALHRAGELGIVHRDIKPDNILLTRQAEAKVADFGLARSLAEKPLNLTQPGVTMGTPLFMSPEQVEAGPTDPRSDLYSLGCTAYFMLTGQAPFRGNTAMAVAMQHLKGTPESLEKLRPDLPIGLIRVVNKLMAKAPGDRFQTGRDVVRELQRVLVESGLTEMAAEVEITEATAANPTATSLPALGRRERLANWFDAHRMSTLLASSLVIAVLGGAAAGWWHREPNLIPPPAAATQPGPPVWQRIERQPSAREQYDHALLLHADDAEAAWLAVANYYPDEVDWVLRAQMQLGRHYLATQQRDKAAALFDTMQSSSDRRAVASGKAGRASVLALNGDSQASLALLDEVRQGGELGMDRQSLDMVLHAYELNFRNLGSDWPPELHRWAQQESQRRTTGNRPVPRPGG